MKVTDQFSNTATASLSITVAQGSLIVTTTSLPNGAQGVPYSATLGAAGGTPPYTWSVTSGTLPDGLNLDPNSGIISGTPTTPGASPFTVQVTDSQSNNASANLQIVINAQITNGSLSRPLRLLRSAPTATATRYSWRAASPPTAMATCWRV